jgi:hypothetical protein
MSAVAEKVDLDALERAAQERLAELRARRQQLSIDALGNRHARAARQGGTRGRGVQAVA